MTEIQATSPSPQIDAEALPRDRSVLDTAALDELTASIRTSRPAPARRALPDRHRLRPRSPATAASSPSAASQERHGARLRHHPRADPRGR